MPKKSATSFKSKKTPAKPVQPAKNNQSKFTWSDGWHLGLAIFVSQLAGIIGSFFTFSEIPNWYANLDKPFFTPPNWLFGPVWITLYTLMGIALFLSCRYGKSARIATKASYWFYAQLAFNALWSIIFFGFHSLWGGFITIVILWLLIFKTIQMFSVVNKSAAWLLMPYILWVSYATALNFALAILN